MTEGRRVTVIGTAGHVDHGKSSLVRALTGTDPDRLEEEKLRGLTIDLGFAHTELPSGNVASFVDVPGHEDFIRNMIAGAGAVDACLLVVAADEGPMPQTREHLAILDLLGIADGAVVLSKADLVDEEWLGLVHEEVTELLSGTSMAHVPVVVASAVTAEGMPELEASLERMVAEAPLPTDRGRPRLSVDRAFTLSGFGTIVTGTLRDGALEPGTAVELVPGPKSARTRSLQSHGRPVDVATPGRRTAVNLSGIEASAIERGDTLTLPGVYRPTGLVDAMLRLVEDAPTSIAHDDEVLVFHGAAESPAHVRLIGCREVAPGERAACQLRLARPTVLVPGDRFIVRRPSPPATIGGGHILDPHPLVRRKRFRTATLERFRALDRALPEDVAWHMLAEREPATADSLRPQETGLEVALRDETLQALRGDGRVHLLGDFWITDRGWESLKRRSLTLLEAYHERFALRQGPPPEELRQQLGLQSDAFGAFLKAALEAGWLARSADALHIPGHVVRFTEAEAAATDRLMGRFESQPYSPPSEKDAAAAIGQEAVAALVARGDLVAVGGDVLFTKDAYDELRSAVDAMLDETGKVTVADVRDRFGTSRKYALALLEHLDRIRVTKREGDLHVRAAPRTGAADSGSAKGEEP